MHISCLPNAYPSPTDCNDGRAIRLRQLALIIFLKRREQSLSCLNFQETVRFLLLTMPESLPLVITFWLRNFNALLTVVLTDVVSIVSPSALIENRFTLSGGCTNTRTPVVVCVDWLIDWFIYSNMFKKATQIIATEDEQDSQAPCALIAALIA